MLAGFHGQRGEAEALALQGRRLGQALNQSAADTYALAQLVPLYRADGRLPALEGELRALIARFPGLPTLSCDLALLLADDGRDDEARAIADRLCADGFAALPRDSLLLVSWALLLETCVVLADAERAGPLMDALGPYADRNLIQGVPVGWGAGAWYLARGAHLRGDAPAARWYADLAEHLHARWGARLLPHPLHSLPGVPTGPGRLSLREQQVLVLLAAGQANKEIAARLHLSLHTVERHVANIFLKLSARNRAEATAWAHRTGLVV